MCKPPPTMTTQAALLPPTMTAHGAELEAQILRARRQRAVVALFGGQY